MWIRRKRGGVLIGRSRAGGRVGGEAWFEGLMFSLSLNARDEGFEYCSRFDGSMLGLIGDDTFDAMPRKKGASIIDRSSLPSDRPSEPKSSEGIASMIPSSQVSILERGASPAHERGDHKMKGVP